MGLLTPRLPALSPLQGGIKHAKTGGDVWAVEEPGAAAAAAGPRVPRQGPLKCNAWDASGRNPAMNVYVCLSGPGPASAGDDDGAPRCKLGVLVSHALPQLAARLGGFSALALDWVTWAADPKTGVPDAASVAGFGSQDGEHWRLLHELVSTARGRSPGFGVLAASGSCVRVL